MSLRVPSHQLPVVAKYIQVSLQYEPVLWALPVVSSHRHSLFFPSTTDRAEAEREIDSKYSVGNLVIVFHFGEKESWRDIFYLHGGPGGLGDTVLVLASNNSTRQGRPRYNTHTLKIKERPLNNSIQSWHFYKSSWKISDLGGWRQQWPHRSCDKALAAEFPLCPSGRSDTQLAHTLVEWDWTAWPQSMPPDFIVGIEGK